MLSNVVRGKKKNGSKYIAGIAMKVGEKTFITEYSRAKTGYIGYRTCEVSDDSVCDFTGYFDGLLNAIFDGDPISMAVRGTNIVMSGHAGCKNGVYGIYGDSPFKYELMESIVSRSGRNPDFSRDPDFLSFAEIEKNFAYFSRKVSDNVLDCVSAPDTVFPYFADIDDSELVNVNKRTRKGDALSN